MEPINNKVAAMLVACWCLVSGLHRDDRGDNENLGRMLILALILIPLVILLGTFGSEIYDSAKTQWEAVMETDVTTKP